MIKIKVPATSANVGMGYDCLGLAVSMYSEFDFDKSDQVLEAVGFEEKFANKNNLVYEAFEKGCQFIGKKTPKVKIEQIKTVPVARGLGSSATCIVAGLKAASIWFGNKISADQIASLATEMEGHPDNVVPATVGGLVISFLKPDKTPEIYRYNVASNLFFVSIIPNYEVSTDEARKVVPKTMSYKDVTYQVSHCAMMIKGIELGNLNLIRETCIDKMHEPYRAKLIPDYQKTKETCEKLGSVLYISGSGSTMMAICDDEKVADNIVTDFSNKFSKWIVEKLNVDLTGVTSEVL